jgi:hypothetical protein
MVCAIDKKWLVLLRISGPNWPGLVPTAADVADGTDDVAQWGVECRTDVDCPSPRPSFTAEGDLNAKRPKECLHPTQSAGECSGIFWPARTSSRDVIASTIGVGPQKI